jgi:hypothetical protein
VTPEQTGYQQRAFNLGSDARLKGRSATTSPYLPGTAQNVAWRAGWLDVENHWGEKAFWNVRPLPAIRDCVSVN